MAQPTHARITSNAGVRDSSVQRTGSAMPVLVDIREVAAHLGVTVRHVRRLVAERRIPYVKWGNLLRFDTAEIAEWVRVKCVEPCGPGPPLVRRRAR